MNRFVTGVSDDLQDKYYSAIRHDNMNIAHLLVHAQQVDEARDKKKSRDTKRAKSFDSGSSMSRLEIQDKTRLKKRVSNQVPSKFPKAHDDRVSNPMPKKGRRY